MTCIKHRVYLIARKCLINMNKKRLFLIGLVFGFIGGLMIIDFSFPSTNILPKYIGNVFAFLFEGL